MIAASILSVEHELFVYMIYNQITSHYYRYFMQGQNSLDYRQSIY